jgi:site-specific DNA recombinase
MTDAVIYLRQSQDASGEGSAIERQEADCRRLAEFRSWNVIEVVPENDTSAAGKVRRDGFERVLAHLKNGSADAVIAERVDRLTRNARDTLRLLEVGKDARAVLAFTQGSDMNLATADGRTMANVLASFAQGEIDRKSERQREANAARAAKGHASWTRRPFGYDKVDGKVVVIEAEAAGIRLAAERVLAGGTLAGSVRDLDAAGLLTTAGNTWNVVTLRRLLLSPRYCARTTYNDVDVAAGTWPPILDADTQQRLGEMLRDTRRQLRKGGIEQKYLMSGSAICGRCGDRMLATRNSQGLMAYRCLRNHLHRAVAPIDETVEAVILARLKRPDAASLLAPDVDIDALRRQSTDLRDRRDGLAEMLAEGLLSREAVREQAGKLTAELKRIEETISAAVGTSPAAALVMAGDVDETWARLSIRDRRTIIDLLATVTVLPVGRGKRWDPERVAEQIRIEWKGVALVNTPG